MCRNKLNNRYLKYKIDGGYEQKYDKYKTKININ